MAEALAAICTSLGCSAAVKPKQVVQLAWEQLGLHVVPDQPLRQQIYAICERSDIRTNWIEFEKPKSPGVRSEQEAFAAVSSHRNLLLVPHDEAQGPAAPPTCTHDVWIFATDGDTKFPTIIRPDRGTRVEATLLITEEHLVLTSVDASSDPHVPMVDDPRVRCTHSDFSTSLCPQR